MVIAKVRVDGVCAETLYCKPIPLGIIGVQVEFEYTDPMWDNLSKTIVFRGSGSRDVIDAENIVTIPAEVVRKEGCWLSVGVYGVDTDGIVAIPTLWAELGVICDAADPSGDPSTDPKLPIWAELQKQIDALKQGDTGGGGSIIVDDDGYLTTTTGGFEIDANGYLIL